VRFGGCFPALIARYPHSSGLRQIPRSSPDDVLANGSRADVRRATLYADTGQLVVRVVAPFRRFSLRPDTFRHVLSTGRQAHFSWSFRKQGGDRCV